MSKLNISYTVNGIECFSKKLIRVRAGSDYVCYNMQVIAELVINDKKFDLVWQTGGSHMFNDYNMPLNDFYLAECGEAISDIYKHHEYDFFSENALNKEHMEYVIESMRDDSGLDLTEQDVYDIYMCILNNTPKIHDFGLDEDDLSCADIDDYNC